MLYNFSQQKKKQCYITKSILQRHEGNVTYQYITQGTNIHLSKI
jgi:hypothetical protein